MNITIKNRPEKSGIYWQEIPLEKRTSSIELETRMKDFALPQSANVICGFPALPDGTGKYQVLVGEGAENAFKEMPEGLKILPQVAVIGDVVTKIADRLGFYMFVKNDIERDQALSGPPTDTIIMPDGSYVENDASGNVASGKTGYTFQQLGGYTQSAPVMYQPYPGQLVPLHLGEQAALGALPLAFVIGLSEFLAALGSILSSLMTILFFLGLIYLGYIVYTKFIHPLLEKLAKHFPKGTPMQYINNVTGGWGSFIATAGAVGIIYYMLKR